MTDLRNASLPEEFTDSLDAWRKAVVGVFARVSKKDVSDVPSDVWRRLIVTTNDGVDISPLYTRADENGAPIDELPGEFPFTRGAAIDADRAGWGVTETFGSYDDAVSEVNRQILHALNSGTTTLRLDLTGQLGPADLKAALEGVYLNMVPVVLSAGARTTEATEALYALADAAGTGLAAVTLGASPLTSAVDGSESVDLDATVELARAASARENVRAVLVDAVSFSNQGASDAQEIALALAAGIDYVRALVNAGLSTEQALDQIAFRFAVTDDQFGQIVKLRTARRLWARVAEVLGHPDLGAAPQHTVTAPVMFSQRDPWVNMLRSTVAAFAAGVGGATDVEVLTYVDGLIPLQLWSIVWIGTGVSILLGIWHRYLARIALNVAASMWLVWSVSYLLSWITYVEGPRYWVTAASMATLAGVIYIVAALMDMTGPPPGKPVPKDPDREPER